MLHAVEDPDSPVRVIVSVAMLKESWDVKSVYVICSLRASVSEILTEQTLGRVELLVERVVATRTTGVLGFEWTDPATPFFRRVCRQRGSCGTTARGHNNGMGGFAGLLCRLPQFARDTPDTCGWSMQQLTGVQLPNQPGADGAETTAIPPGWTRIVIGRTPVASIGTSWAVISGPEPRAGLTKIAQPDPSGTVTATR
jgi:hypothetical protein